MLPLTHDPNFISPDAWELKIDSSLQERPVQFALVCEAVLLEVVLHVTPPNLRPHLTCELKFDSARQLVTPIGTIHRFADDSAAFRLQLK